MINALAFHCRYHRTATVFVHTAFWLGMAFAFACAPDLNQYNCDDDADCGVGQICVEGRCAPGQTVVDVENDESVSDTELDTADIPGNTDAIEDSDVLELAGDQDADVTPMCWSSLNVGLFEPCEGVEDECVNGQRSTSSWDRLNEPVEVPLVNGINDVSVLAYFNFDELSALTANTGRGGDGITATIEPPCGEDPLTTCLDGLDVSNLDNSLELTDGRQLEIDLSDDSLSGAEEWSILLWFNVCGPLPTQSHIPLLTALDGDQSRLEIGLGFGELSLSMKTASAEEYSGTLLQIAIISDANCQYDISEASDASFSLAVVQPPNEIPQVFINGELVPWDEWEPEAPDAFPSCDTIIVGGDRTSSDIEGEVDEVIVVRRALWPYEIRTYVQSRSPFGSNLFSDSDWDPTDPQSTDGSLPQADFDDLRITMADSDYPVPFEVIGARPFSDGFQTLRSSTVYENFDWTTGVGRFGWDRAPDFGVLDGQYQEGLAIDISSFPFGESDEFTVDLWVSVRKVGTIFSYKNQNGGEITIESFEDPPHFGFRVYLTDTEENPRIVVASDPFLTLEDRWHHLAFVHRPDISTDRFALFIDGLRANDPSPEATLGEMRPFGEDSPFGIGGMVNEYGVDPDGFEGRVDDLVIHDWALDDELIRRRAQPLIPMVRFLAKAEADTDYPQYSLEWGEVDDFLPPMFRFDTEDEEQVDRCAESTMFDDTEACCVGLLSSCVGYIGWWRFDEGRGVTLLDASSANLHAIAAGVDDTIAWIEGIDGLGVDFDTGDDLAFVSPLGQIDDPREMLIEIVLDSTDEGSSSPKTILHFVTDTGTTSRRLWLNTDNHLVLSAREQGEAGERTLFTSGTSVWPDSWYHLAVMTNVSSEDQLRTEVKVDHSQLDTNVAQFADPVSIDRLGIGSEIHLESTIWFPTVGAGFEGSIDSVRIIMSTPSGDIHLHHPLSRSNAWEHEPEQRGEGCTGTGD